LNADASVFTIVLPPLKHNSLFNIGINNKQEKSFENIG